MMPDTLKQFIHDHLNDDPAALMLQRSRYPDVDVAFAVQQIEGRRKASQKLPTMAANPDFVFPPQLNLEQASSELTADYKSAQFAENKVIIDITGGLGIDSIFFAKRAKKVVYIEQDPQLFAIAECNLNALKISNIEPLCGNSAELLASGRLRADLVYADPARRDTLGRKMVSLADCTPDIVQLMPMLLQIAPQVLIKTSPMLDIAMAKRQLPHVHETQVVAVRNECKELLLLCGKVDEMSQSTVCVDITAEGKPMMFSPTEEEMQASPVVAEKVGRYLYDPGSAVSKAQMCRPLAVRHGLPVLHPSGRMATSERPVAGYLGRVFEVQQEVSLSSKELKKLLPQGKANVVCRNFPQTADQLRQQLKLSDGGDFFLFATTLAGGKKTGILCRRV